MFSLLKKCLAGAVCVVSSGLLFAETIGAVKVELPDQSSAPESLVTLIRLTTESAAGQECNPSVISKDIGELYKTNKLNSVKYRLEKDEDGNTVIVWMVDPKKPVTAIVFTGNAVYKEKKLLGKIKHKTNVLLDNAQLSKDCNEVMKFYSEGGYYGTVVTASSRVNEDGKGLTVTFNVQEAERHKLQGVAFQGNTVFTHDELKNAIMTKRQWWRYIFRFGNYFNSKLLDYDKDKIRELYETKGYWDCRVTDVELVFDEDNNWVTPTYKISEGVQYTVAAILLRESEKFTAEELLAKTGLKVGDVFSSTQLEKDLSAMKAEYECLGYIDLRINPTISRNAASKSATIEYFVSEGIPCRIREITIVGNTNTQDKVIRRELAIEPDDLADAGKIRLSRQRIMNLGYFNEVNTTTEMTDSAAMRDLRIEVAEKPTGSLSLGAGFSTEDSFIVYGELAERNFDIAKLLKLERPIGAGQRFRTYVGFGEDTQNLVISWTEPSLADTDFELNTDLFLNTRFEDEYDERHLGGSLMLSWPVAFTLPGFGEHVEYWKMGLGLRAEETRISNIDKSEKYDGAWPDGPFEGSFKDGREYSLMEDKGSYFTNRLVWRMIRDTRNTYFFPTEGSKVELEAEYVTKALGSYADYAKVHGGVDKYVPIAYDLIMKFSLDGSSAEHFSGDDIAIFDRYFAGGYGTVRGFKRHDVSPKNQKEHSIGGLTMITSSVEVIKPVQDFMFFRVFTDVGNVWWDSFDADFDDFNASVGAGVQFKAVPVRLDYGFPVKTNDQIDNKSGRLHFNIDYSF